MKVYRAFTAETEISDAADTLESFKRNFRRGAKRARSRTGGWNKIRIMDANRQRQINRYMKRSDRVQLNQLLRRKYFVN